MEEKCICYVHSHNDKLKNTCHPSECLSCKRDYPSHILHWARCSYEKKEKIIPPTSELFGEKSLTDSVLCFVSVTIEAEPV